MRRILVPAAVAALLLSGCAAEQPPEETFSSGDLDGHGSRAELYESFDELASDSAVVAIVEVRSQEVVYDLDGQQPFTLSTAAVVESMAMESLGTGLPSDLAPRGETPSEVVVRQMGGDGLPIEAALEPDRTYLLFLSPSGLEGALASQYYVTGATAGVFVPTSDVEAAGAAETTFEHLGPYEGDSLPEQVTPADLR